MEDFLAARGQSQEEWEAEVKKTAERRVMSSIIVQKLSDELKIEVSDQEIEQQVAEMLAVYKNDPKAVEQLSSPEARNSIANRIRINKTMDKLAELNRPHATASKKAAKKPAAKKPATKKAKK
jgi:trigger factor